MKARLQRLLAVLGDGLIERQTPVRLALLSALAGEHMLLIGPHGTAKSVLARKLHLVFDDGQYFERLLTKFSVPEELFGPLSIKALEQDRYLRLTDRYLPSARIAFIDEIFKANSAILNALLTLLNEKEFDNGDQRQPVPLVSVIGASNELPDEPELLALYDRFLCRYEVELVSPDQFEALLQLDDTSAPEPAPEDLLTDADLQNLLAEANQIPLSEAFMTLLQALREELQRKQIYISDRRWCKIVKWLKVAAYTNQQEQVSIWDGWLLQHCLWDAPSQQAFIAEWYQSHIGLGSGFNPDRLDKLVSTWENTFRKDQSSQTQQTNAQHQLLYLDPDGHTTTTAAYMEWCERDGKNLYLSPPDQADRSNEGRGFTFEELQEQFFDDIYQQTHIDGKWNHIDKYISNPANRLVKQHPHQPLMEPTLHPPSLIQRRVEESQSIESDLRLLLNKLEAQRKALSQELAEHLWIDGDFVVEAEQSLNQSISLAENMTHRMQRVIDGYQQLPTLDDSPATTA